MQRSLLKPFKSFERISMIGLLLSLMVMGCFTPNRLQRRQLLPYPNNLEVHHKIYQLTPTKTVLAIETNARLFRLSIQGYSEEVSKEPIFDFTEVLSKSEDQPAADLVQKIVHLPTMLQEFAIDVIIADLETNEVFHDLIYINKNENECQRSIRIYGANGSDRLLLRKYVPKGSTLRFEGSDQNINENSNQSSNQAQQKFYIRHFQTAFKAAKPPHLYDGTPFDIANTGNLPQNLYEVTAATNFVIKEAGLYYVQTDTASTCGIYINCFDFDFPTLTNLDQLTESTRYITRNSEYIKVTRSIEKKLALDEFWLERTKNDKVRAKELIKTYYNRVQYANTYFTTYKEGWKTDRGIIYIIFGKPNRIQKSTTREYWEYSNGQGRESAPFYFLADANGQYSLQRLPYLEKYWKAQVYEWRKGLVSTN